MTFEEWWDKNAHHLISEIMEAKIGRAKSRVGDAWNAALRAASEEMLRCCCSHPRHEHNVDSGKCEDAQCDCMNLCDCWAIVVEARESELPGILATTFDKIKHVSQSFPGEMQKFSQ